MVHQRDRRHARTRRICRRPLLRRLHGHSRTRYTRRADAADRARSNSCPRAHELKVNRHLMNDGSSRIKEKPALRVSKSTRVASRTVPYRRQGVDGAYAAR